MIDDDRTCSAIELAEFLNMTQRRIQQLANDGVIKRRSRGEYLFLDSIKSYIKFIQEAAYGDRAIGTDLQAARARESKLKGDMLVIDIAQKAGQLVLVDEIEPRLSTWAAMGRNEVVNAFHKVIADIEALNNIEVDEKALQPHIESALKAIASYPQVSTKSLPTSDLNNEEINHGY